MKFFENMKTLVPTSGKDDEYVRGRIDTMRNSVDKLCRKSLVGEREVDKNPRFGGPGGRC